MMLFEKINKTLVGIDSIAAAYIFGSATSSTSNVVNDIDLLILTAPESNPFEAMYQVSTHVGKAMNISSDTIDVLLF